MTANKRMGAAPRMGFWWTLYLKVVCGCYLTSSFHAYLRWLFNASRTGCTLDKFSAWFIQRADVQRYWQEEAPHVWIAHQTQGGSRFTVGEYNRAEALEMFARLARGANVIHIDDVHHFIFFKQAE